MNDRCIKWWRKCGRDWAVFLQVCVGAEAEDKFHMVEIEGLTYDGKSTKVPLAVLKPSIMPSVSARHEGYKFMKVLQWKTTSVLNTVVTMKTKPLYDNYLSTYSFFLPCHLFTTLSCPDEFRWIRDHASCYLPPPSWFWSSSHQWATFC